MGPAITQELPGGKLLRVGRVGEVHDVHEAAEAFGRALADVVRSTVRGKVAHVGRVAWQVDAALQDRAGAVGGRITDKRQTPSSPFGCPR